jgi:hypothetical protein
MVMTDAFQCDRCGESKDGSGEFFRIDKPVPSRLLTSLSIGFRARLCEDCYAGLFDMAREYVGEDGDRL